MNVLRVMVPMSCEVLRSDFVSRVMNFSTEGKYFSVHWKIYSFVICQIAYDFKHSLPRFQSHRRSGCG